jgi:hypothetical protein
MLTGVIDWFGDLVREVLDTYAHDSRFGRAGLVLFLGLGVLLGGVSLLVFPEPFFWSFRLSMLMGLVLPIVAGMLVAGFGGVKLLDWEFKFNLERFGAAFCVTLALGVTRFVWFLVELFSH